MAFSPLSGGPVATLEAIVRAGSDESRMAAATPLVWALIVIGVAALSGVAEELLFRGALYGWLRRRLPSRPRSPSPPSCSPWNTATTPS